MGLPWDGFILVSKLTPDKIKSLRVLAAGPAFQQELLAPFAARHFWDDGIFITASTENFSAALSNGQSVLVFPEGTDGISKGFECRYELQPFATSFVRMAIKHRVDVVPIYTINGEYLNPGAFTWRRLNRIAAKFGIPFVPLGPMLLLSVIPSLFYFAWPAHLTYIVGSPINLQINEGLNDPEIRQLTEQIRLSMQAELSRLVSERGRVKFEWAGFFAQISTLKLKSIFLIPIFWPYLFFKISIKFNPSTLTSLVLSCSEKLSL